MENKKEVQKWKLTVDLAKDCHAYEVMNNPRVLITKVGLNDLTERLK